MGLKSSPDRLVGVDPGWVYVCEDGSYTRQVLIQKLKSGMIRLLCPNTGGKSEAMAKELLAVAQNMVDEGKVDWSEVDVENVES